MPTDQTTRVLREVGAEREAQDAKWGEQNHHNGTGHELMLPRGSAREQANRAQVENDRAVVDGHISFLAILVEELLEANAETDRARLRAELVQLAAVAVGWIEAIDREAELHAQYLALVADDQCRKAESGEGVVR